MYMQGQIGLKNEDTFCKIWVFVFRQVTPLKDYRFVKFHEIRLSGSLENG